MAKGYAHERPKKEPRLSSKTAISLFIGFIMIVSTAGFAVMQSAGTNQPAPSNPLDETFQINRTLTPAEKVYILRTGRMILENIYNESGDELPQLADFASKHATYVFVEQSMVNASEEGSPEPGLRAIGSGGSIRDLDATNVTEDALADLICDFGIARPVECTLRGM